jgi:hypothetical protein
MISILICRELKLRHLAFIETKKFFDQIRENIFLKSWQFIDDNSQIKLNNSYLPKTIL